MHLALIGVNHKTAPVSVREKLCFPDDILASAYARLSSLAPVRGCVILSTCNRIELYVSTPDIDEGFESITSFMEHFHGIPREEFERFTYRKHCGQAVSHLFKVAASLDSMVIGEYQIQGQVREAYSYAAAGGFTNNLLNKLFQTAIQAGKSIRTETEIGRGTVSVASVAVDVMTGIFKDAGSFNLLILGAGKMAALTASSISASKHCSITVINRTEDKAEELASRFNARVESFDKKYEAMLQNDVIVVSTGSPDYVLESREVQRALSRSVAEKRTRFLIDLSMPRNIDPAINEIDGMIVYSLDDLQNVVSGNLDKRVGEVKKAEEIVETIAADYYEWYMKQSVLPVMQHIKGELQVLKMRVLAANKQRLSGFDAARQEIMEQVLDQYSEKLIKVIMKNLKSVTPGDNIQAMMSALKNTLNVEDE